jgi:hypothetical protein
MRIRFIAPLALLVSAACGGRARSELFDFTGDAGGTSAPVDGGTVVNPRPPPPFDAGITCATTGKCNVSYEKDIVPIFNQACSTSSCHGTTYPPFMPSKEPKLTWSNLSDWKSRTSARLPYINVCSTDPKDSYILDNLGYDKTRPSEAGQRMPLGAPLPKEQVKLIEEWVRCGAPLN